MNSTFIAEKSEEKTGFWSIDTDKLVREYENEVATARKDRLRKAFKEITGEEIDYRLRILKD